MRIAVNRMHSHETPEYGNCRAQGGALHPRQRLTWPARCAGAFAAPPLPDGSAQFTSLFISPQPAIHGRLPLATVSCSAGHDALNVNTRIGKHRATLTWVLIRELKAMKSVRWAPVLTPLKVPNGDAAHRRTRHGRRVQARQAGTPVVAGGAVRVAAQRPPDMARAGVQGAGS